MLNLFGFIAAFLIQCSKEMPLLQDVKILILLIIILRAGYSSFVSLAFVEMEKSGISSVVISGIFFWISNAVNLVEA